MTSPNATASTSILGDFPMKLFTKALASGAVWLALSHGVLAQPASTVVLWEEGFPAVDTAAPDRAALAALPGARLATARELPALLASSQTHLLVLPYGSAFPEGSWNAIYAYLQRGGNLLAIGGRPFSVAVADGGRARYPRQAWARALFINDYTETPGKPQSGGLLMSDNPDLPEVHLPEFWFNRSWSLEARLSAKDLYHRIGSAGSLETRLDTLQRCFTTGEHQVAAPVVELDHLQNNFVGGRWVLVPAQLPGALPVPVLKALAERAAQGASDVGIEAVCALVEPGEPARFNVRQRTGAKLTRLQITEDGGPAVESLLGATLQLGPPKGPGFHSVTVRFYAGSKLFAQSRSGYWVRDPKALESGPVVTVDQHYFRVDGRPQPIVGTTYMASDVQRQFLVHPNPFVWDRDFAQMKKNGINMIRTGIWSGWDNVMTQDGVVNETALRNLEALLLTARRYEIPVQFNFFAFIPDAFGGANAYLDPEAVRREQQYMTAIVSRFSKAPWLMWDLINEPSFDKAEHLWATRANGDRFESQLWNDYVKRVHGDPGAVANAWNSVTPPARLPVPSEDDFSAGSVGHDGKPLMVHDFYLFAQERFLAWAKSMRATIRATGSQQLVTVGQDEGGGFDRLNPSYWMDATDFTTNHSWWQTDGLLWDSLVAVQPGQPALIQETGVMPDLHVDGNWRRTPDERAHLLERKGALALATTAGVIQWLWNVNAVMTDNGEVTIGAVRPDGTEKPEAAVMRNLATFANTNRDRFRDPQQPDVAIVFDHDLLYSPFFEMATQAQRKSVRIMHSYLHTPAYAVAENRIAQMGHPKLAVLPSPQALDETAWKSLVQYMTEGGTLLVTGSFERDPYWRVTDRLKRLGVQAQVAPLNFHQGSIGVDGATVPVSFSDPFWLDRLRLDEGGAAEASGWKEVPVGKGRLLLTSLPMELSEGNEATAAIYAAALRRAGVESPYVVGKLSPGVLVRPVVLADSILYLFVSESGQDERVEVRDRATGADLNFTLPALRTFLVLLNRADGRRIASYGLQS